MNKIFIITILAFATGCSVQWADGMAEKGFDEACLRHYSSAMRIYHRGVFFNKKSAELYWRRGDLFARNGRYKRAIQDFTRSLSIDAQFNEGYAYWDRAECKRQLGDYTAALSDYDEAIAVSPEKSNFYYPRATLRYYQLHDTLGALSDLDHAIKFWEGYVLARLCRAELKVKMGDFEGAMEDYHKIRQRFLEYDPNDADEFYFRGIAKYETGDRDGACEDLLASAELGYQKAQEKYNKLCYCK